MRRSRRDVEVRGSGFTRREAVIGGSAAWAALLAGCSGGGGNDDPSSRGPVSIEEVAFAAGRPNGYGEYEPQPDATYGPDDVVWIYAELSAISGEPVNESDGANRSDEAESGAGDGDGASSDGDGATGAEETIVDVDLRQTLRVEDPDGALVVETTAEIQQTLSVRQLDAFYIATDVLTAGTPAVGEYTATITVTDRVSETETTETATFSIES